MPAISVSAPIGKITEMYKKSLGPSRVFQLGLDIALKEGIECLEKLQAQINILQKILQDKEEIIIKLRKDVDNAKDNYVFYKEKCEEYALKEEKQ